MIRNRAVRGWRIHFSKRMWLLLALLALLPVMAWLQYRWIGQVSDAAGQRAKARLDNSIEQLITEFDGEITRAHLIFWQAQPDQEEPPAERIAERFRDWSHRAPYPQLIREVHLIEVSAEPWMVSRVDSTARIERLPEWPPGFTEVRSRMEAMSAPGFRRGVGWDDLSAAGNPVFLVPMREPRGEPEQRSRRFGRPIGWVAVTLDAEFIRREFLPEITRRVFPQSSESEYELMVVKAGDPEATIYQSDPTPARNLLTSPDATAGLFAM